MKISRSHGQASEVLLDVAAGTGGPVRLGIVTMRAGERVPPSGVSRHAHAEHSYVLQGEIVVTVDGIRSAARSGDLISIAAGEAHFTEVQSDAAVLYLLIG